MTYYIFVMLSIVMVITVFTTFTMDVLGQTSNLTFQDNKIFNQTQNPQQSEEQVQILDKKIIKFLCFFLNVL